MTAITLTSRRERVCIEADHSSKTFRAGGTGDCCRPSRMNGSSRYSSSFLQFDESVVMEAASKFAAEEALAKLTREGMTTAERDEALSGLTRAVRPLEYPIGLLATARVRVEFISRPPPTILTPPAVLVERGSDASIWAVENPPKVIWRWNIIILVVGALIVAIVGGGALIPPSKLGTGLPQLTQPSRGRLQKTANSARPLSAEEYLVTDVERALQRSEQLFSRSTLLLVGGVVMAFVGVGVFFVSLSELDQALSVTRSATTMLPNVVPQGNSVRSELQSETLLQKLGLPSQQLFLTFKASAMLIFIEATAWFLLRQYRALIEDYKAFYRYYMRRANYLAAQRLASEHSDKSLMVRVVETLLAEDLTGRLRTGETTEDLEGIRSIDPNFAESVVVKTSEIAQRALGHGKA